MNVQLFSFHIQTINNNVKSVIEKWNGHKVIPYGKYFALEFAFPIALLLVSEKVYLVMLAVFTAKFAFYFLLVTLGDILIKNDYSNLFPDINQKPKDDKEKEFIENYKKQREDQLNSIQLKKEYFTGGNEKKFTEENFLKFLKSIEMPLKMTFTWSIISILEIQSPFKIIAVASAIFSATKSIVCLIKY